VCLVVIVRHHSVLGRCVVFQRRVRLGVFCLRLYGASESSSAPFGAASEVVRCFCCFLLCFGGCCRLCPAVLGVEAVYDICRTVRRRWASPGSLLLTFVGVGRLCG